MFIFEEYGAFKVFTIFIVTEQLLEHFHGDCKQNDLS